MFILSLVLALTSFSTNAFAEQEYLSISTELGESSSCFTDTADSVSWKYCITVTSESDSKDVLYDFHGLGGSENDWLDKDRNIGIRKFWKNEKIDAPTVVSVSFGQVWLLAEKNPSALSGLYEAFTRIVIPRIEAKLTELDGKRILMGASMGGFNASQILLKNPELFDRYVLACPIITNISLFASQAEIQQYQQENNASYMKVGTMLGLGRQFYPDVASWDKAWPMLLAKTNLNKETTPPLHISAGQSDEYGIHNSVMMFKDIALEQGVNVTWQSLKGGHCITNPPSIAKFIVN